MTDCYACGREAGPNKIYCDDDCYMLANGHIERNPRDLHKSRELKIRSHCVNSDPTMRTAAQIQEEQLWQNANDPEMDARIVAAYEAGRRFERQQVIALLNHYQRLHD